jgi:hypothetical protein
MRPVATALFVVFVVHAVCLSAPSSEAVYRSAQIDREGQLHLLLASGRQFVPHRLKGQVSFSHVSISEDGHTAGWLVGYADPGATSDKADDLSGTLVLYRNGHQLRRFDTEQVFWDWKFVDRGGKVAYCTGPTHGGAADCLLRDLQTGKVTARWTVEKDDAHVPVWARGMHY